MPRGKNGEISFDDRELDLRREILEILPPYEGGGWEGGSLTACSAAMWNGRRYPALAAKDRRS